MLELQFDDGFYLSDVYSSDEESNEGPSYLGNDELHSQDLNSLDRAVTFAEKLAVAEAAVMNVKTMK